MSKTKPTNATLFGDWAEYCYGSDDWRIGIVRCPDGDLKAWRWLSMQVLDWADYPADTPLAEPVWKWWRWNPDPSGEFKQLIGEAKGPGRGNWRGAEVIMKAVPA